MACAICSKAISNADGFFTLECGHVVHSMHQTVDCSLCIASSSTSSVVNSDIGAPAYKQSVENLPADRRTNAVPAASTPGVMLYPTAEKILEEKIRENRAKCDMEDRQSLAPPAGSKAKTLLVNLMKVANRISEMNKPDTESSDPHVLLAAGVPLGQFVDRYGISITSMINNHGITINDFFKNGYTMTAICESFPNRMNDKEGMDVLYHLGISAEHFRRAPEFVEVGVLQERLGYRPEMLQALGYEFAPGTWTLQELVDVGMTLEGVIACGMKYKTELQQLLATAKSQEDIDAFDMVPAQVARLMDAPPQIPLGRQQQQSHVPSSKTVAVPGQRSQQQQQPDLRTLMQIAKMADANNAVSVPVGQPEKRVLVVEPFCPKQVAQVASVSSLYQQQQQQQAQCAVETVTYREPIQVSASVPASVVTAKVAASSSYAAAPKLRPLAYVPFAMPK